MGSEKTCWENVYIFISSTFNDMHAERDYLIKQVFPQLREWCERRKLRLIDIDLRWGVTEQDALYNKNVVKVCLDRINDCRPFFLCFLGQRRGWVPATEDVSDETLAAYPGLSDVVGSASVTEMEILHAILTPFHRQGPDQPTTSAEYYQPAKHSFFYLRDTSYLDELPAEPPLVRQTFTNEGEAPEQRARDDRELARWRTEDIPRTSRPCHTYRARWDSLARSPEVHLPLECPSIEPVNVARWREQWARANVEVTGTSVEPPAAGHAEAFNELLTRGRLTDFETGGVPLSAVIIRELQEAIATRFADHTEVAYEDDLGKELDQQGEFLFASSEGFIEREGVFDELDAYVAGDSDRLFILTAPAGMGKSTVLARWIERHRSRLCDESGESVYFRFIGQSDRSTNVRDLLHFLLRELGVDGKLPKTTREKRMTAAGYRETVKVPFEIPDGPEGLRKAWQQTLDQLGHHGKTTIVIDALNQLESGLDDLGWLPRQLPASVKLIVSCKRDDPSAEALLRQLREESQAVLSEVKPFESLDDRRRLVRVYLSQYLKELDDQHMEALVRSPGAASPLYLKVVLSELRVFGSFADLGEKIRRDFGDAPVPAFNSVLSRLENDPAYSPIEPRVAVPLLFGLLAHARRGLAADELTDLFVQALGLEPAPASRKDATETVHFFLRQVRPFLSRREARYDFFFESFKIAALQRYVLESSEGHTAKRSAEEWHRLLATYFSSLPTWQKDVASPTTEGRRDLRPVQRKVSELPYHQANGGMDNDFVRTMTTFDFLRAKLEALGPQSLIEDYDLGAVPMLSLGEKGEGLRLIQSALRLSAHILALDTAQLATQLLGRMLDLEQTEVKSLLEEALSWTDQPWLRPLTVCLNPPGGLLVRTLAGHTKSITAVAVSPDGKLAVSGSEDDTLRVWDLVSGKTLHELRGHQHHPSTVVITADSRRAVSISQGGELRVWNLASGECLHDLSGYADSSYGVAVTENGRRAIAVSMGAMKVWDLENGTCLGTFGGVAPMLSSLVVTPDCQRAVAKRIHEANPRVWDLSNGECLFTLGGHPESAYLIVVSPDGSRAATAARDHAVRIWNLATGERLQTLSGHTDSVNAMRFTPDGRFVVSASSDHSLKVWDLESGECLHTLSGHTEPVTVLAVTPDGRRIISAPSGMIDETQRVWDLSSGQCLNAFSVHAGAIKAIAFTPDGRHTLSASDGTLRVWDLASGIRRANTAHGDGITSVAFTADSKLAVSASKDKTLKIWDLASGECLRTLSGHTASVSSVVVLRDGERIVSAGDDKTLKIWSLVSGDCLRTLSGHASGIERVIGIPDGRRMVSAAKDGELRVWDLTTGRCLHTLNGHADQLWDLALASDGGVAVSASMDKTLRVWDLTSGKCSHTLVGHTDGVWTVALTMEGRLALSTSKDKTLRVWDLRSGQCLHTLPGLWDWHSPIAVVTADGRAVSRTQEGSINVWDLASGKRLHSLEGHGQRVRDLAVTPDGRRALSASDDKTLRLWDLASGQCLRTVDSGHADLVWQLAITPDGKQALSGARSDGTLHVWDLESLTCRARFSADDELPSMVLSPNGQVFAGVDCKGLRLLRLENATLPLTDVIARSSDGLRVLDPASSDTQNASITHGDGVTAVAFTADSRLAVSASKDKTLKVWDIANGECLHTLSGHAGSVRSVVVLSDGERIVSAGDDKTLKIWSLASGDCLRTLSGHSSGVKSVVKMPDDRRVISVSEEGELRVWDPAGGQCLHTLDGHGGGLQDLALTPDGHIAVSASMDKTLRVWDLSSGQCLHTLVGHADWVWTVALTMEGRLALSTSKDKTLRVWDLRSGQCLHTLPGLWDWHSPIAVVTADGRAISRTQEGSINVWDLASGKRLHSLEGHGQRVRDLAVTPDGRRALSAFDDNTLRLWDLASGQCLRTVDSGHTDPVWQLAITLDGKRAIDVSRNDGTIRTWDIESLVCRAIPLCDDDEPFPLAISPDGQVLAGFNSEGIAIYRLEVAAPTSPAAVPPVTNDDKGTKPGLLRRIFGGR